MKTVLVAAAIVAGTAGVAMAAQTATGRAGMAMSHHRMVLPTKKKTIAANGRCGGISYGTGARRCGSRSGGPSGGNSSRN